MMLHIWIAPLEMVQSLGAKKFFNDQDISLPISNFLE